MSDPQPRHAITAGFYYVRCWPAPGLPETERESGDTEDETNHPDARRVNPLRGSSTAFRPCR